MLEPQSTIFFALLILIFAGLMTWLIITRHIVVRIFAAVLAFVPAVLFGVAAVNKYYDYYQTWGAAISDLTGSGAPAAVVGTRVGSSTGISKLLGKYYYTSIAKQDGLTVRLTVRGRLSHLKRTVYVYLPPQYFQSAYRDYRFPAIELLHGFPGAPQDWITVLDVTTTLTSLVNRGLARPAVLVMPDANGARGISLQCLNQVGGPQDATFIAQDVPNYIARTFRVWQPGRSWGIAGYSEGGFCAANLGLQFGSRFGFAGVLSGYFSPMANQVGHPARPVDPFAGNRKLRLANTPTHELLTLPAGALIPKFWIGTGSDPSDLRGAQIFRQLLQLRQPSVQLDVIKGGSHTMFTWRALVPPMLEWMTPQLAVNVQLAEARAKRLAAHPHAHLARHRVHHRPPHRRARTPHKQPSRK